jgi:hypothetical protein
MQSRDFYSNRFTLTEVADQLASNPTIYFQARFASPFYQQSLPKIPS